ncbi:MATE family efflux transporter [Verrucomicrobiota bacterium]
MMNNNDLTTGNLRKGLLGLAGPMLVGAVLQNVQSFIDLFWVGRLGTNAVAALGMSGTVLMMMFPIIMGMSAGTVAYVSRKVGEHDFAAASSAAGQSLVIALVLGITAGLTGAFFATPLLRLLDASPEVLSLGTAYLQISFLGSFTIFVLFIGNSILRAAGNSILPMYAMACANILNVILDPIFIFGFKGIPGMGVSGAALATVLSQAIAAIGVVILISRGSTHIKVNLKQWKFIPSVAWKVVRIGIPSAWQMLSRSLMALVIMNIVSQFGMLATAAYYIGLRFFMISIMPAFALGNAAATIVGQNLGARQPKRAQAAAWLAVRIDMIIMFIIGAILFIAAPELIRIFDKTPEVISIGTNYIRTVAPFFFFAGTGIILGRALNGAGETMSTMILTILCLWGIQVPAALILPKVLQPATQGIWWAISLAVSIHGISVITWFQMGHWKRKRVD